MNEENPAPQGSDDSLKTITMVVYALQLASFLAGISLLIAVVVNCVKKSDVQGTWLASHFKWQLRTFWFTILWWASALIVLFLVGPLLGVLLFIVSVLWMIYRIVQGWVRLYEGKEMYTEP